MDEIQQREVIVLAWLAQTDPNAFERLNRVKEVDERLYLLQLMRSARMMERSEADPAILERHQQMRALQQRIDELARQYRDSGDKAVRAEVTALVTELFESRQTDRHATLEALEAKINTLRTEIDNRERERKRVIEDYVDQALAEPVDL